MNILLALGLFALAVVAVVVVLARNLEDRAAGILLLLVAALCVLGGLVILRPAPASLRILNSFNAVAPHETLH